MDDETRKAFAGVHLALCAIEGMVLKLLVNEAIRDGDEESKKEIEETFNQIKESSKYFADVVKRE